MRGDDNQCEDKECFSVILSLCSVVPNSSLILKLERLANGADGGRGFNETLRKHMCLIVGEIGLETRLMMWTGHGTQRVSSSATSLFLHASLEEAKCVF